MSKSNNYPDFEAIQQLSEQIQQATTEKWLKHTNTRYILHVGKTCSGKTYQAIERLKTASEGCYLAPLRLLAWEIAEKLNEAGVKCSLLTGEERIPVDGAKITSSTIEMLDYGINYDIAVIDECFMLADMDRGKHWLRAILEIQASEVHLILNEEVEELLSEILTIANKTFEVKRYARLTELRVDELPYDTENPKDKTIFVVFSRMKALLYKSLFEKQGYGVSVLYGNLPPESKKDQIERFMSGENKLCIATDVIGMGLNLPCEHVCFLELMKFDGVTQRNLTHTEIKQIGGRAGRYGFSDVGYVCTPHEHQISFIKSAMNGNRKIEHARWGLDINTFIAIPRKTAIQKLTYFRKMTCIPKELGHIVKKENIDRLIELADDEAINELPIELAWVMINSPVKKNNEMYFQNTILGLKLERKINKPQFLDTFTAREIYDTKNLEYYETGLSEIDLYTYLCNNNTTRAYVENILPEIQKVKEEMIDRINAFLVDRSKTYVKTCQDCDRELDISWPHRKCNSCFHSNRYQRWDY